MRIAVVHDYADLFRATPTYSKLSGHEVVVYTDAYNDPNKLVEQVSEWHALVLTNQRVRVSRQVIERLPQLKFICQTSDQMDHLDVDARTAHGVVVSSEGGLADSNFHTTAELTWGPILASLRNIPYEVERLRNGYWQSTVGTRLFGKTLGVYAFGKIGGAVAKIGRAFGVKVVCWGRENSTARAKAKGFDIAPSRAALFESADVLTLHLRSNKETRGIVTSNDLDRMKTSALLVNTSRAQLIAEGALVAALEKGRPGFAAVDVYEAEPVIGCDHPLLKMKNALCSPHLGYGERDSYARKYTGAVERLLAFAEGKPINVVNPKAMS